MTGHYWIQSLGYLLGSAMLVGTVRAAARSITSREDSPRGRRSR